jgi:signal transduction histidine kinase
LSRQATALKDGLVVPPLEPSGIFEIDAVGHAIYDTSNVLESRTAEREAALAALRLEVTDRRRVERQLLHAQKMDAVGRLTSGIAHDFNNILAGVVGSLEFVTDRIAGDNESLVALNSAIDTAMLGSELTGRLLAFARQQPLTSADVDVNNTVRSLVPLLRRTLGGGITVETHLRDGLWKATADPSQLQDAALNLCINARDAMPDGGVLRIETSNVTFDAAYAESNIDMVPGDYVMMAISDTGTGMSAEVQLRAFEPFFTTKEEGHGNGLGLSMVYGFVKQSAGHIKIYSECDRGTSIMLYLPRCPNEIGAPESPPRVLANPIVASGETILVVDDFDAVRGAACRSLRSLGYRVVEASSAEQALQLIDDGLAIDLLFTDIVMPGGMTGQALAREIRKRLPGTPVVLTSGYADTVDMNGGEAVTILRKPFRREELKARMKEALTMP